MSAGLSCPWRSKADCLAHPELPWISHFLLRLTCIMTSLTVPTRDLSLPRFDQRICFFHHRDIDHMKVVVIHILLQSFRHGPGLRSSACMTAERIYCSPPRSLQQLCMHRCRIAWHTHSRRGCGSKRSSHQKFSSPYFTASAFRPRVEIAPSVSSDRTWRHSCRWGFEVDIPVGLGGINILVGVALLFSFVYAPEPFATSSRVGQVLVTGKGAVDSVVSGPWKSVPFCCVADGLGTGMHFCGKCNNPL